MNKEEMRFIKRTVNGCWAVKVANDHLSHLPRCSRSVARESQLLTRVPRCWQHPARFQSHCLVSGDDQTQIQHFLKNCFPDLSFTREA